MTLIYFLQRRNETKFVSKKMCFFYVTDFFFPAFIPLYLSGWFSLMNGEIFLGAIPTRSIQSDWLIVLLKFHPSLKRE